MIVIAGAGIGGLTLACALARIGRPFQVLDRVDELRPAGAGIALSENAFRALAHVGLDDRVRSCGHDLGVAALCDAQGRVLIESRIRDLVGGRTTAMARTALQHTLVNALEASPRLGVAVVGYEHRTRGVRVLLDSGDRLDADLLIGADGLHSTVRRTMRGEEPLRYAGYTSWRALVDDVDVGDPDRFTETWGPGKRFGIVPIGPRSIYWFAVADAPPGGRDGADPRRELHRRFSGWHPPIDRLIAAAAPDRILRTDIFDRRPIRRWVQGRVALLGDAAHPMTPNLGQGGGQAIEDAVVLADALQREPDVDAALARYQARRVRRANDFVVRSFRFGQLAHIKSPVGRWLRDRMMRVMPVSATARSIARDLRFEL